MLARWLNVALLILSGCASAPAPTNTARPSSPPIAGSVAAATHVAASEQAVDSDTSGILGHVPSEWQTSQWFNSPPLTLAGLRGRVVFVRWFTSPDCPFCAGSAPALRELHQRYAHQGLVVIGMYHHKDDQPLDPENVRGWAKHYGYEFPVAIDADWRTLNRWWLDGHPHRGFTSVSFLLDRTGVVRRVHLGGLIDVKSDEFRAIAADTERLLAEPPLEAPAALPALAPFPSGSVLSPR